MSKKITEKPTRHVRAVVSEISDDELSARTAQGSAEWKAVLQSATTKNIRISFDTYRNARICAQRITAVRSFYGFDVKVMHRGNDVFCTPRGANKVEIDNVELDQ